MGQTYDHLSLRERVEIDLWREAGHSLRWIGRHLGRSAATISRELRRNARPTKQWYGSYHGEPTMLWPGAAAAGMPASSWRASRTCAIMSDNALRWDTRPSRSPAGWRTSKVDPLSARVHLPLYLSSLEPEGSLAPPSAPAQEPARPSGPARRLPGQLHQHRLAVAHRPPEANSRKVEGHWEADLMAFSRYGQYVLVIHERFSRLLLVDRLPNKTAGAVLERLHRC